MKIKQKEVDWTNNKYLDIHNIEHTVNYVTGSSELLKLDRIEKIKPKVTMDFPSYMNGGEAKIFKKKLQ